MNTKLTYNSVASHSESWMREDLARLIQIQHRHPEDKEIARQVANLEWILHVHYDEGGE